MKIVKRERIAFAVNAVLRAYTLHTRWLDLQCAHFLLPVCLFVCRIIRLHPQ